MNGLIGAMENTWVCPDHGFGTNSPKMWGLHKKEHHEGKDPRPKPRPEDEPQGSEGIVRAVRLIREERARFAMEAAKIAVEASRVAQEIERLDNVLGLLTNTQVTP